MNDNLVKYQRGDRECEAKGQRLFKYIFVKDNDYKTMENRKSSFDPLDGATQLAWVVYANTHIVSSKSVQSM